MPKYRKNFIADVIVKIDFDTVTNLQEQPTEFENRISADFPVKEPIQQQGIMLEKKEDGPILTKQVAATVWTYKNQSKDLIVELTQNFLVINCKKYEDFNTLQQKVNSIFEAFFDIYKIEKINRLGLRYIDRILLKDKDLFVWNKYINESLIKNLDFIEEKDSLRRVMQAYEIVPEDDTNLSFKSGVFNSWYPNKLLEKEFFIDCDCYTPIQFKTTDINGKLTKFHSICSKYFEKSINQAFRDEVLNYE